MMIKNMSIDRSAVKGERIILVCEDFELVDRDGFPVEDMYGNKKTRLMVNYAMTEHTMESVILDGDTKHPSEYGAKFDETIGEWVMEA